VDQDEYLCFVSTNSPSGLAVGPRERFLILAREASFAAENLRRILSPLGTVEVVLDRFSGLVGNYTSDAVDAPSEPFIRISDDEAVGYGNLMGKSGDFPMISAWSRAFVHLERTLEEDEAVWFIEDDVAGDSGAFAEWVARTSSVGADLSAFDLRTRWEDQEWPWWNDAIAYFGEPCAGFQPLCRMSGRLVRAVLEFRRRHGSFVFHEVLFPSLARELEMSWLDWRQESQFKPYVGTFHYRPEVAVPVRGISHPVKLVDIHAAICGRPQEEFPRISSASLGGWSILKEDYVFLVRFCRRMKFGRIVEFGPGDSTLAFLDADCRIVSFDHDASWLQTATERFAHEPDVVVKHCREGTVPERQEIGFEPELVMVDGPPFREGQEMSRLLPCEWAIENCGCFLLHDTRRHGELATLREMRRRGMHVVEIPTRKGLALVFDPARRTDLITNQVKQLLARYESEGATGWFTKEELAWKILFGSGSEPAKVLEIGSQDGLSANLMLDLLFVHPESEVHCIQERDEVTDLSVRFDANLRRGGHAAQLSLYEGLSREVLAWMIAGEGFWQSFDFIHLHASERPSDLLADACQAWELLKSGGVMIFGAPASAQAGRSAFLSVYSPLLEIILEGERLAIRKK
jgi:hypothetical protein